MKKFKLLPLMLTLFVAIGITSCDVEPVDSELLGNNPENPNNPDNPNNPAAPATFTVDFNGQTFTATQTYAYMSDGLMAIQGIRGTNGEEVSIAMPANGVGTYDAAELLMNYTPNAADEYGYTNISFSTGETSGTVVITAVDAVNNTISGTFSFTGWYGDEDAGLDPIEFTNGSFTNVPYTTEAGNEDTFTADIDGTSFNTQNIIPAWADAGAGATININALDDNLNNITIVIKDELTPGTYAFSNEPVFDVRGTYTIYATDVEYTAESGTLTISTKTDTMIAGTFSFTAVNDAGEMVTVTNGTFSVEY